VYSQITPSYAKLFGVGGFSPEKSKDKALIGVKGTRCKGKIASVFPFPSCLLIPFTP